MAGKYSLDQELALISRLDLLICMDSANMHFASLVGTRVLSVWGATHPYAGFYGYHQDPEDCIQLDLPSLFRIRPKALPAEGLGVYETAQSGSNHKQGINLFK